jgi:biotin carboxyl carrier protein
MVLLRFKKWQIKLSRTLKARRNEAKTPLITETKPTLADRGNARSTRTPPALADETTGTGLIVYRIEQTLQSESPGTLVELLVQEGQHVQ